MDEQARRSNEKSGSGPPHTRNDTPPAGPHSKPELTNPDATPGTGALPDVESDDPNVASTS